VFPSRLEDWLKGEMSPSLESSGQTRAPHEIKFLISRELAERIRHWAAEFMEHDPHTEASLNHAYRVRSIYFDTPQFDVFHKRGSFARGKYRIREYLPAGILFLERKLKANGVVRKRRTTVAADELARLVESPNKSWSGFWYHRRLALRRLQPTCAISYLRFPFISGNRSDPLRLTLDQLVIATPSDGFRFPETNGHGEVLPEQAILELKYLGETPALFKSLADQFGLTPQPVSKYRLALPALGLAKRIEPTKESPVQVPLVCT